MWIPTEHEKYGVVLANFRGTVQHGLPLEIGDTVQILEKCEGWYRGFIIKNPNVKGIFPCTYVHLKHAHVKNKGQFETVIPMEESVVTEMTVTLREWGTMWKQLYVKNDGELFHRLWHVMTEILELRQQVLLGHLTHDRMTDIKQHVIARLDWGNEQLGLDLVPRRDFSMVDPDEISVTELYRLMERRHRRQDLPPQANMHHLFLQLNGLLNCSLGEELDVFFFIYDGREMRPISERFFVRLNKQGLPKSPERTERQCTLFVDLGSSDLRKDVYVVAHIFRIGRMVAGEKKSVCNTQYRRPFGCTVISVSDLLTADCKDDHLLKVYSCNTESEWYQIHDNIVRKVSSRYSQIGSGTGLAVSLQLLHGDLEQIQKDYMRLFTNSVSITRRLGFSDIIMPGEVRNDLYITLERGEFEKGGKSVARNVEVTVYLLGVDGQVLKGMVCSGSGEPGMDEFHSLVLYHSNSPRWSEMIKLSVPLELFRATHLRFEFRHCSTKEKGEKKLFGFSFVPLMQEDGRTLPDGTHELIVHKCEETANLQESSRYLKLSFSKASLQPGQNQTIKNSKESFWILSQLCSTKLTQNGDMLDLLKWRTHPDRIMDCLSKLKDIDGAEIVKFLQDTLDTLFAVLDESPQRYGLKVFDCLVHVINLLQDSKFQHFKPIMDNYIEHHFAGALSYRDLIRVLKWYVDRIIDTEHQEQIQQVLKAAEYLFKFIVQSRMLYTAAAAGQGEEEFRCSIHELFKSVHLFLSHESKGISPITHTQAVFLRSFPIVCSELLKVFNVREVANLARDTLNSMPALSHTDCPLQAVKLQCMAKTVESPLYTNPESRCVLLPVVLHLLHTYLQEQKELVLCANILTGMLSLVHRDPNTECVVSEEVNIIMESLSGVLLRTILEVTSHPQPTATSLRLQYQDVTGEFVACLLTLLRQLSDKDYQKLLSRFPNKDELANFLLQLFTVFRILIRPDMFPKDWTVMRLVTNNVIITTVLYLSDTLRNNFLNEKFDFKVWESYLYLSIVFVIQPCLQLEMFPPSKRKKVLEKYGDMRVMIGCEIFSMWQNLGDYKVNLIPSLIGPFLEVTLVPQSDLRNVLIPVFHDMMDSEERRSGNFKQVEAKLIDKLESLMSEGKGDETYKELFNNIIPLFGPYPSLLKKIERETWRESGVSHIATVTRLMERLLDYRDCMKIGEVDGKKIGCTVNLLNFYKTELNKEEMYIRYIHKLYELHLKVQNYTEAAYTLLLYDELLEWTERPLREFLTYPMQSEWQRKECLHLTIIHNFDRGKCWENCIILCRELANQHEAYYDYRNLSKMRLMEASLYDKIMNQQRLEPEFFRIGFYGKKFPFFLRNKEFVCRGNDYERLEAFQQRMLSEFPHAIAMQHANQPDQTILQAEAQYLQIYAVTPVPDNRDVLQRDGVPNNIKSFYKVNHIWRFRYDRPFHKGTKDKENEFKSLWVERTTLSLAQSLPGISRWFEVEKRDLVEMSPLENASEVIENKTLQLRTLIAQCQTRQMQNINPLTMCLNGVIDAAVNGGLTRYQEAFFAKDYISSHPEDGDKITRLRELMFEQAHILEYGLAVHEKFVPQDMRPLHKKLVDQFHVMRSSLGIQPQEFPAYVRVSPLHFANGSPRTCRTPVPNAISPDGGRIVARRSPLSYPAVNRYSSSSLSSQASNDVSNITGQSESSDEVFNMQPSPSTSSLSSNHSGSHNVTGSAVSSSRDALPSASPLPLDKHKQSRENACLSPRDRLCSSMFPSALDSAQRMMPFQIDTSLPRCEAGLPTTDTGKSIRSLSPMPTARSPQKTTAPPLTPSPTDGLPAGSLASHSPARSGSYSSGISSLSRCSVSEMCSVEPSPPDPPLPPVAPVDNLVRRGSKTPPPYSVYERNNPRRATPLPHSLSVPPTVDNPNLPSKPHLSRTQRILSEPRHRLTPRKVSQL
ncbi:dedicator of cytokinesis protein 4 isoform X2 [Electrophorus electricus]|uniref:dedicator of cytokinesis protein 4 isoform X2 n=1 Tax=Electrophorus electricus TaxID=8005 RepID=UPI0015CFE028|nr:dedicator of cytokinesis protein 4 isoform X2 [Electrophorus electricus]